MRRPTVKRWRKPKDAEELFRTIQVFLDDAFGLFGSSTRSRGGGDVDIDLKRAACRIVVQDEDREDGVLWVKLSRSEQKAFRSWVKAGQPANREPSAN